MTIDEVMQHPDLSDDAKALFLMMCVNTSHGIVTAELPDTHWWTPQSTESMLDELAYFGVLGRSVS